MNETIYLKIAIPCPHKEAFDYLLPSDTAQFSNIEQASLIGKRVLVPFGKRELIGICVGTCSSTHLKPEQLKSVIEIIDETPLLPARMLELCSKISRYYHFNIGEILQTGLPVDLRKGKILKTLKDTAIAPTEGDTKDSDTNYSPFTLNEHQLSCIDAVLAQIGKHQTFVLNGVTGSGKSEVYFQILAKILESGKQGMLLIPEIALSPQTTKRLQERFKHQVHLYHSALTNKQKREVWQRAREGESGIYVGTRSALFLPCTNLALLVVDEEHDSAYKQQEGFKYHARDVAVLRGSIEGCPVVLGSATPSLESLSNVNKGLYTQIMLPHRAGGAHLSPIEVIDVRHNQLEGGLSAKLIHALKEPLKRGEQVMLYLNRRGYSPIYMCYGCGHIFECKKCDAKLTFHSNKNRLLCHHCDYSVAIPKACPSCQHDQLDPLGIGTERLEEVLTTALSDIDGVEIIRIDSDTTSKKGILEEKLERLRQSGPKVLVGTQMLAKGHHFPEVTLVAIVDVDQGLYSADFKATEKMAQMIIQVAGRAGRAAKKGRVLLQTFHPDHIFFKNLLNEGYANFAKTELDARQKSGLPPFAHLCIFRAESPMGERPMQFLSSLGALLVQQSQSGIECYGPIPAPMEKRSGRYRAQLILSGKSRRELHIGIEKILRFIEKNKLGTKLGWSLDIDPIDTY